MPRDTIVQENGKVLPEFEEQRYPHHHHHQNVSWEEKKIRSKPLKTKKKVYEFFTAPITKFWANSVS